MPPKVLVLPKAAGPRVAEAINSHATAIVALNTQVSILTTLTEPMTRPFLGRLKWLFLGR